jgi:hypothetical protein
MSEATVITYPVVGTTTLAVIAETAVMEATVHLLDLPTPSAALSRLPWPSLRRGTCSSPFLIQPQRLRHSQVGRMRQSPCPRSADFTAN